MPQHDNGKEKAVTEPKFIILRNRGVHKQDGDIKYTITILKDSPAPPGMIETGRLIGEHKMVEYCYPEELDLYKDLPQ